MKRGFICLLLVALTYALDDNVGAETKDVASTKGTNINFYYDKSKRGATKITNVDNASFNHLSASSGVSGANSGFKPISTTSTASNASPIRYVYNQQFYQPNPYLAYVQYPQAAQIAAQYSFQSNPVAHFLQTPNQIQYVSTPTVAQVPQVKYQEYTSSNSVGSESSATSASTQYVPQSQSVVSPSQGYVSGAQASVSSVSSSQGKQVSLYPNYQSVQPVFYQQPVFTYLTQPQTANFVYQQPNVNYLFKQQQQQQQPLAGFYGANKLGLYTPTQNAQLAYTLVPMAIASPVQDSTVTTSDLKTSDKTTSNSQQTSSANSFNYGTKG